MAVFESLANFLLNCALAPMPYQWKLMETDASLVLRLVMNIGSYFVSLILFSIAGLKFLKDRASSLGYLRDKGKWTLPILAAILALTQIMWAAFLHMAYISFCGFYPWPTFTFACVGFYKTVWKAEGPSMLQTMFSMVGEHLSSSLQFWPFGHAEPEAEAAAAAAAQEEQQQPPQAEEEHEGFFQRLRHFFSRDSVAAPSTEANHHQAAAIAPLPVAAAAAGGGGLGAAAAAAAAAVCGQCVALGSQQTQDTYIVRQVRTTRTGLVYGPPSQYLPAQQAIQ